MQIMNNSAAIAALGELRKNDTSLGKQLKKVSSGMKINGAGDGAAEYAISEKMRVRTRSLDQDIENAQTGKNLIRTAEGGIQNIIDNLRSMKALAIDAANDTNTDDDRAIIQKEQDSRIQTIDDIANCTEYNGRILLNGNYGLKTREAASTGPNGPVKLLHSGDQTIDADGTYILERGFTGHLTVNASNVKITQEDTTEKLYKTSVECTQAGSSLWLDNVWFQDGAINYTAAISGFKTNVVKFNGSGNSLHIQNDVHLYGGCNGSAGNDATDFAAINVGDGLSIYGEKSNARLWAVCEDGVGGNSQGAGIGTDMGQVTAGDLLISGLSYLRTWSEEGVGIGAASNSTMGNIVLKDIKTLEVGTRLGAGIGATSGGVVGNISISADGIWGVLTTAGDANGTNIGEHGGTCGTIDINANYIYLGACYSDPSRGTYATHQNCTGTTILPTATINGMAFNPNGQSYAKDPSLKNNQVYEYIGPDSSLSDEAEKTPRGLRIHTGTKANQNLFVTINSMDADTLGIDGIKMVPRENALASLSVLDSAIDYALDENTRMGAYQTRLDFTVSNLTTSNENTQASESTIRDADMAREMTGYTKANVLAQSAQAMLAQANQNASSVLQLLS